MIFLDTNALIRFFTNDDSQKALKVKRLLEKERDISIIDVVFPEIEYVLRDVYNLPRSKIVTLIKFLLSLSNMKVSSEMKIAITYYETTNLDMADSLIIASAQKGRLASFDNQLLKMTNVKKYW